MTFSRFSVAAVLFALGSSVACGRSRSSEPGSGETHFLITCQQSCGGGLECLCGVCSRVCDDDLACSDLARGATCVERDAGCTEVTRACDLTCVSDQDCRGLSGEHACSAGHCRTAPSAPMGVSGSGGSLGGASGSGGSLGGAGGSAGGGGPPVSGGTGTMLPPGTFCESCDPASWNCGVRGTCSEEAACETVGCGGAIVAEDGCVRPACEQDSECAEDARCASVPVTRFGVLTGTVCRPGPDGCDCGVASVGGWMKICSPMASSGQRGVWLSLRVQEWSYLAENDLTQWIFRPDGSVEVSTYAVHGSPTLPAPSSQRTAQADIEDLVDSPLRAELADPTPCAVVEDYDLDVVLELDGATLEKRVSGCTDDYWLLRTFDELRTVLERSRN